MQEKLQRRYERGENVLGLEIDDEKVIFHGGYFDGIH